MANSLQTIAPANLIGQRILDTLIQTYPFFTSIGADFSSEAVPMGTTISVHQPNALSAGDYSTSTGYTPQDVSQTERPLVINKFKHATYFFNDQERSSSAISLIERFAEAGAYAIGSSMVTDLFALVTSGNYSNATTVAVGSFARSSVTALGKTLTGRKVAPIGRKLIVNSDYFEKLQNDTVLVANPGSPADTVRSGAYGGGLRPHIVLQDRSVRKPKVGMHGGHPNYILDEYLSVAFWRGPEPIPMGNPFWLTLYLWCHPDPMYDGCVPGATFTIREGGKIIGHGEIKRRWNEEEKAFNPMPEPQAT